MSPAVRVASTSAVAALVLAAVWLFWPASLGGGTTYVVTHGISMEPDFRTGDLAVLRPAASYDVGDVVAYESPSLDTIVMHRIVDVDRDRFVLQGDNNDWLDEDRPTSEELLGSLYLRVPRGGEALAALGSPGVLALIAVAGLAVFAVTGRTPARRPGRSRRRPVRSPRHRALAFPVQIRARARQVALAAGVGVLVAAVGLGVLLALPSTEAESRTIQVALQGQFSYSGTAERGTTYPTGALATGDPIYTRLTDALVVTFQAVVSAPGLDSVSGTAWLDVSVVTPDGWTADLGRGATGTIENGTVTVSTPVDPVRAAAFLARHHDEIGTNGGGASLVVTPTVAATGAVGGRPFSVGSPAPLTLGMDAASLRLTGGAAALTPVVQVPVVVEEVVERNVVVVGVAVPVDVARSLVAVVLAVSLVALAVAGWIGRPRRGDAADEFLLRHAARILPVDGFTTGTTVVDVADTQALTRVAARIDGLFLHLAGPDGQTLAVQDSETTYRYVFPPELAGRAPRQAPPPPRPAPLRAVPDPAPEDVTPSDVTSPDATRPLGRLAG